eukprot:COSAG02_NODE_3421_length_6773_cov_2.734043_6_plen_541_part_00
MGDSRAGSSAGYGFHGQKQGATLPSLRNGVERYDTTIIKPSSVSTGANFNGEITFDFTSANNRWLVPSMCALEVQLVAGRTTAERLAHDNNGAGVGGLGGQAQLDAAINAAMPTVGQTPAAHADSSRFVTDPISALFRAMRLTASGVQVENLDHVHLASLLQLATETTPAMADSTLQVGGQAFDWKARVADLATPGGGDQNVRAVVAQEPFVRNKGQVLLRHATPTAEFGQAAANQGITLRIPLPLNFFSAQEWIPACRWQLTLEVDPNHQAKSTFNLSHTATRDNYAGNPDAIENLAVQIKDISLSVCTVKPLIPKVVESLQMHVPSQAIQMIPLNASTSGDYTIAVPASTFGVMCVVRDSTTDERFDGASDRWARGQNIKNIRWSLGSSQWPTGSDYDLDLRSDAAAVDGALAAGNANHPRTREWTDAHRDYTGQHGIVKCTMKGARAYADFVDLCSKKYSPGGMQMDYEDWCSNPIFGARLMTPPGEIATNLRIHVDLHSLPVANDTLYVCALYSKVATMNWAPEVEYPSVKVDHSI